MSKKANPAAIGIFVVGAIVLAVVAILMFGSGKFFSQTEQFILYCDDSVNGLDIGAPVKFKGVKIGQVSRIYIRHNQIPESTAIPIVIEIDTKRLRDTLGVDIDLADPEAFHEHVNFGLRAQLQQASFVTGLLYVELNYYPNADPPRFVQLPDNQQYLEIPTISSDFNEVFATAASTLSSLSRFNFAGIGEQIEVLLEEVNNDLREVEFARINQELLGALASAQRLLANPEIQEAITTFNATLTDGRNTLHKLDAKIDPLILDLEQTTAAARATLATFQRVGGSAEIFLQPNSALVVQMEDALRELGDAARAIRLLAEFIEQNPNALLTGKQAPKQ